MIRRTMPRLAMKPKPKGKLGHMETPPPGLTAMHGRSIPMHPGGTTARGVPQTQVNTKTKVEKKTPHGKVTETKTTHSPPMKRKKKG